MLLRRGLRRALRRPLAERGNDFLGVIQWYAPWRRYTFCTKAAEMVFDFACLTEIANFISDRMNERASV